MIRTLFLILVLAVPGMAQISPVPSPIDTYLEGMVITIPEILRLPPPDRTTELSRLLPDVRASQFSRYVMASSTDFASLIDTFRLNKLVGASGGGSGTTSLVSKVATPAVLGFAVEHGAVIQASSGTVQTVRGNLLGLARVALGAEQFPYCPEIAQPSCNSLSRSLRRFSGSVSFEEIRGEDEGLSAGTSAGPTTMDLFGSDFRMASWGVRFDLTATNNLDDPKYIEVWRTQVARLRSDPAAGSLTNAFNDLFQNSLPQLVEWKASAMTALTAVQSETEVRTVLREQLDLLIELMAAADPGYKDKAKALQRAYAQYFLVRDELLREAQTHKMSLEYVNAHPRNEPSRSTVRFIYSHQPTNDPAIVTINAGTTFYNTANGVSRRLRDVQLGGQLDRRLRTVKDLGQVVLTLATYYQWLRDDVTVVPGATTLQGTGIPIPDNAVSLLGTKGHIGVAQVKLSLPLSNGVKIPLSMTWSNRTEFIKERETRGQVGITLDIDNLFR